jgi:hypothetical protein
MFGPLRQHSGGCCFYNNEEGEVAVHEWLQMQKPDFYHTGTFKLMPRWDTRINVLWDCTEKQKYFSGIISYI